MLLYFRFEIWELGAINTKLMSSELTPNTTPPLRSQFSTKPTNLSCEGNEDTGHFVDCRKSSRNPLMCPLTGCHLWQFKEQQVPTFISLTGVSEHEAIPEAHHFTCTLCSKVSKYSASIGCDKGRCCPLMTMPLA